MSARNGDVCASISSSTATSSAKNPPEADAELIALAIDVVRVFGFTSQDFVVRISDREFWTELLEARESAA